jgi:primosomal protein N' (replication factor Y)
MVTKGLDFEHVSVVGILNADTMLNFPDYRAHERAFQLMVQVSGRAGRKHKRGLVILQTSNPKHPVIEQVVHNNYDALYSTQTNERSQFKYPPYYRIIEINLRHKMPDVVKKAAFELAGRLRQVFGARILGPVDPPVGRIQNMYIKLLLLKIELDANPAKAKELLTEISDLLLSESKFKSVKISLDVDPM